MANRVETVELGGGVVFRSDGARAMVFYPARPRSEQPIGHRVRVALVLGGFGAFVCACGFASFGGSAAMVFFLAPLVAAALRLAALAREWSRVGHELRIKGRSMRFRRVARHRGGRESRTPSHPFAPDGPAEAVATRVVVTYAALTPDAPPQLTSRPPVWSTLYGTTATLSAEVEGDTPWPIWPEPLFAPEAEAVAGRFAAALGVPLGRAVVFSADRAATPDESLPAPSHKLLRCEEWPGGFRCLAYARDPEVEHCRDNRTFGLVVLATVGALAAGYLFPHPDLRALLLTAALLAAALALIVGAAAVSIRRLAAARPPLYESGTRLPTGIADAADVPGLPPAVVFAVIAGELGVTENKVTFRCRGDEVRDVAVVCEARTVGGGDNGDSIEYYYFVEVTTADGRSARWAVPPFDLSSDDKKTFMGTRQGHRWLAGRLRRALRETNPAA